MSERIVIKMSYREAFLALTLGAAICCLLIWAVISFSGYPHATLHKTMQMDRLVDRATVAKMRYHGTYYLINDGSPDYFYRDGKKVYVR